ncbi:4-hydroxythreonine-4-phosphate dehydrogenase PdxA [Kushneria marisflavi]|uniref:4-hydroxythreonine-4-phosphate dehydrogenase n=1 Tax=Kushneria marisflavi TaxID=157779 RepID=A0A240UPN0_9GAMM|nr:4-hydroxythreonine-4-phosphate dehydrogenase PdxA [Kushneria marisflavi]ART63075.1 4-hydroxythreonine-4-phosphate dehydrogenase [Kushneria marisflavi]RKD84677.1 4-hydroxythreonine-4-phosphate dehydrogenase [Kushneria marisflavi]
MTHNSSASAADRPLIALAMGDPAGISPELTARLAVDPQVNAAARLVIIGDRRVFDEGARTAGLSPELVDTTLEALKAGAPDQVAFVDLGHLSLDEVEQGVPSLAGGTFCSRNFNEALALAGDGHVDAVCFTPFNKQAMRYANPDYDDEIRFVARAIGFKGKAREFNILDNIWNARVTSHIPLSQVAASLNENSILEEIALTQQCLTQSGIETPRIAVAGLNPHAGDGGNFGREEIEIIEPAVAKARDRGWAVEGPFPADTVFLRAPREGYHAVLTMYHDQGQIAMKLMGFDSGVTMLGGFPFPVCTPAHGTAYDIAGQGIADIGASRQALLLAARMAARLQHAAA